uniref:CARDB domain-containing protein n=1 Tax=Candidatus Methanogaster sp. ANME-2c ERB4 TaxID=2759911 RepID=A0A7G9YKJ1_9EURY|nr:hypothetical protein NKHFGJIK_00003 [Methanosarcinales archaeon ANME-2c ERB4]
MTRLIQLICLGIFILISISLVVASETTIGVDNYSVEPGNTIKAPIMINDTVMLGGGVINFTYDPTVVRMTDVLQGDLRFSFKYKINNGSGWMRANALDVGGLSGNVTFAHLDLTAVGDDGDASPLNIASANIFDIGYTTIAYTVNNGSFAIISRDLVITQKSESWVVMKDKTYNIAYTLANTGSGDAGASTTSITIDGVDAATDAVPALSQGESHTAALGPFTMTGDSDTIEVCADMDDVVSESNEENNCKENRFEHPVPVPVLTPPGLVALIGLLMVVAVRRVKKGG